MDVDRSYIGYICAHGSQFPMSTAYKITLPGHRITNYSFVVIAVEKRGLSQLVLGKMWFTFAVRCGPCHLLKLNVGSERRSVGCELWAS